MDFVNAIAKVRFGTAKPQHVQLHKSDSMLVELLCMESNQDTTIRSGEWVYYVIAGQATLTADGKSTELPTGQLAAIGADEVHTLANTAESRLVVLATGKMT